MTNCLLTKILRDNAQMFTNASTHLGTNVFFYSSKTGTKNRNKGEKDSKQRGIYVKLSSVRLSTGFVTTYRWQGLGLYLSVGCFSSPLSIKAVSISLTSLSDFQSRNGNKGLVVDWCYLTSVTSTTYSSLFTRVLTKQL